MWLLESAQQYTGVPTVVSETQLLDLEESEVFYHRLFLLYTEVDLCAKIIPTMIIVIGVVTKASNCGTEI